MKRLIVLAALGLVGCAQPGPQPLYQWEGYQAALYEHLKASAGDPTEQISKLEAQRQKNAAQGRASPPGMQAHLGLLYSRVGDEAAALAALQAEKQQFPEAASFIDFLLQSGKKSANVTSQPKAAVVRPAQP